MPVPPYTITFQPSSSSTALVSRVIVPHPSGASGVHEGPMVLVLKTYQSLGGPDRISSQKRITKSPCHDSTSPGITNTLVHLSLIPAIGNSRKGCPGRTPSTRLAPKTRHRILSDRLDPHHTPKTHAKISPCSNLVLPSLRHLVPCAHTSLPHQHHIIDIMRVRVKQ
jgi:hypothetical protein